MTQEEVKQAIEAMLPKEKIIYNIYNQALSDTANSLSKRVVTVSEILKREDIHNEEDLIEALQKEFLILKRKEK